MVQQFEVISNSLESITDLSIFVISMNLTWWKDLLVLW